MLVSVLLLVVFWQVEVSKDAAIGGLISGGLSGLSAGMFGGAEAEQVQVQIPPLSWYSWCSYSSNCRRWSLNALPMEEVHQVLVRAGAQLGAFGMPEAAGAAGDPLASAGAGTGLGTAGSAVANAQTAIHPSSHSTGATTSGRSS